MSQASMVRPTELVADFFARGPSREEIAAFHLPAETAAYVRELLYKNSAGTLTPEESQELDELALLDRIVNLIRSRVPLGRDGVMLKPPSIIGRPGSEQ